MKTAILIAAVFATVALASAQQPPSPPLPPTQPPQLAPAPMQPQTPQSPMPSQPAPGPMQPQSPRGMPPQAPTPPHGPMAPQPPQPPMDPLGDALFPPELIMSHTRELGLTDEQKTFMRGEIQKTTTRFTELQWQLQDAVEALHDTMKSSSVNEQQALAQLNRVLDTEREIKTLHITMAIRLKNKLTVEQQEKLQAMRTPRAAPLPQ